MQVEVGAFLPLLVIYGKLMLDAYTFIVGGLLQEV